MSPFGDRFAQSPSQTGHTPLDVSGFPFVIDISRLAFSDFPETLGTYDEGFSLHMKHLFTPFRCAFQLFHATGHELYKEIAMEIEEKLDKNLMTFWNAYKYLSKSGETSYPMHPMN